jgi:hypothetical protein
MRKRARPILAAMGSNNKGCPTAVFVGSVNPAEVKQILNATLITQVIACPGG